LSGRVWKDDNAPEYQVKVGLEVHVQLDIATKLFSPAPSKSKTVNGSLHGFDVAVPGFLPQLSTEAVQKAVLLSAALDCTIPTLSVFERKHYVYADLPLSYQITQQQHPLGHSGMIECEWKLSNKQRKKLKDLSPSIRCRVDRIQLEQDTAKTVTHVVDGKTFSRVDFSRAGCALVEVVMAPDLSSSLQAASVVHGLRQLVRTTGASQGKMELGQMRVDANVNIVGDGSKSPRVEVKNLNSIQQVKDAIDYEAARAAAAMGELSVEETRTWNVAEKCTVLMRRKDTAVDYRFFPDPDLQPLYIEDTLQQPLDDFLESNLPELPAATKRRLKEDLNLSEYQASLIAADPSASKLLEETIGSSKSMDAASAAANLICNELTALVKEHAVVVEDASDEEDDYVSMEDSPVSGKQLGELIDMLQVAETISMTMAKKLLAMLFKHKGASPKELAGENNIKLISDMTELTSICQTVVDEHPKQAAEFKQDSKTAAKIMKLLIGKAMKATKGNAHPERLRDALEDVLNSR